MVAGVVDELHDLEGVEVAEEAGAEGFWGVGVAADFGEALAEGLFC